MENEYIHTIYGSITQEEAEILNEMWNIAITEEREVIKKVGNDLYSCNSTMYEENITGYIHKNSDMYAIMNFDSINNSTTICPINEK